MKKVLALILAASILFSGNSIWASQSTEKNIKNIQKTSDAATAENFTLELGTYNGKKIKWRYVGSDANGRLMMSEEILCYKSLDAANAEYSNYFRQKYDSNYWEGSALKKWLNTSGTVTWGSGAVPTSENVKGGNGYDTELGFLTGFSEEELKLIKETTQPTYLNHSDADKRSGGSERFDFDADEKSFDTLFSTMEKNKNGWYQLTTEKIFLIGPEQFKNACEQVGKEYMSIEKPYWM